MNWDIPIEERPALPDGLRYLTAEDTWQNGDSYNGNGSELWVVGTKQTGIKAGTNVGKSGFLCYWPRGSTKREFPL